MDSIQSISTNWLPKLEIMKIKNQRKNAHNLHPVILVRIKCIYILWYIYDRIEPVAYIQITWRTVKAVKNKTKLTMI